jgi:protein required for attachment to host cells
MKITGPLAEQGLHVFDHEPRMHEGHMIPRIWFLVADREKAHVYRKTPHGLELIADLKANGHARTVDGHTLKDHGPAEKGAHDVRGEKTHHGDNAFIRTLVDWLDVAERERVYDRLVLVAAPHTLGEIRAALPRSVHDRVTAELPKQLTGASVKDIFDHLNREVWF